MKNSNLWSSLVFISPSIRKKKSKKERKILWVCVWVYPVHPMDRRRRRQWKRVLKWVHMTPKKNKLLVSQLVITFRLSLFLILLFLLHTFPTLARINFPTSDNGDILVIMSNGTNITSITRNFKDFKKMFGVNYDAPSNSDKRDIETTFISGQGKLFF